MTGRAWFIPVWTTVVLLGATVALNNTRSGQNGAETRPPLSYLARCITLPLVLTDSADVRAYALPIGLAGLLMLFAIRRAAAPGSGPAAIPPADPHRVEAILSRHWLAAMAILVLLAGMASATVNQTWPPSRGWLFQFACGAGWSLALAHCAPFVPPSRILSGLFITAILSAAATFWHREVLGFRYPVWPIGPITIVSALGMLVGLAALTVLIGWLSLHRDARRGVSRAMLGLAIVATLVATAMLIVSGRRSAYLGVAAGLLTAAVWMLRCRRAGWRGWLAISVIAAFGIAGATQWIVGQSRSTAREQSGSLALRFELWRYAARSIVDRPILGRGPDQFLCGSATDLALARAVRPHELHGALEPSAHNEWLQAAYELGVTGGLIYSMIPLAAVLAALRIGHLIDTSQRLVLGAACVALAAVVVAEASSINLRYPILTAWYWTLIGVIAGAERSVRPASAARAYIGPGIRRLAAVGAGMAIVFVVFNDAVSSAAHARGREQLGRDDRAAIALLELGVDRMGCAASLKAREELGIAWSNLARASAGAESTTGDRADESPVRRAIAVWESLVRMCPGYPQAEVRLAEMYVRAKDAERVKDALMHYLRAIDPYDPVANVLYARHVAWDTAGRIRAMQHALRSSALGSQIAAMLALNVPLEADADWDYQVSRASAELQSPDVRRWRDSLAPELLRIEAWRRARMDRMHGAARMQFIAAQAYELLERGNAPVRRPAEAECDAWLRAAEYAFRDRPNDPSSALEMVRKAERYAVLGIRHEYLRRVEPGGEFVGDQVVPVELPERLRPLWRESARFRMAAGEERGLEMRLVSALPAEGRTPEGVDRLRRELAAELVRAMRELPPGQRPATFRALESLAGEESPSKGE